MSRRDKSEPPREFGFLMWCPECREETGHIPILSDHVHTYQCTKPRLTLFDKNGKEFREPQWIPCSEPIVSMVIGHDGETGKPIGVWMGADPFQLTLMYLRMDEASWVFERWMLKRLKAAGLVARDAHIEPPERGKGFIETVRARWRRSDG